VGQEGEALRPEMLKEELAPANGDLGIGATNPDQPVWLVLHTRQKHEGGAEQALPRQGLEVLPPRLVVPSRRGEHRLRLSGPLFSGHLIIQGSLGNPPSPEILKTKDIVRLLGLNCRAATVPREKLESPRRGRGIQGKGRGSRAKRGGVCRGTGQGNHSLLPRWCRD
jgi:hypothetical protein